MEFEFDENVSAENFSVENCEGDNKNGYSLLVADNKNNIKIWIDTYIKDHDISQEFNRYIFHVSLLTDRREIEYQENGTFLDPLFSVSLAYLVDNKKMSHDEKGNWRYC